MDVVKSLRDRIVGKLTPTEGPELDIACNLTDRGQTTVFIEEMGYSRLGSSYIIDRTNMLKRLTCSWQGRARDDLTEIGRTPEFASQKGTSFEDH